MCTGAGWHTYDTLLRRRWNNAATMQVLLNQLLMKTEEVTEPPINFHLGFAEIRNVCLKHNRKT